MKNICRNILFVLILSFVFFPFQGRATVLDFNIDPAYDYQGRSEITAFLHQIGGNAYFYVEDNYYNGLSIEDKKTFSDSVKALSDEFDNIIYPQLTALYGSEWKSGIDNDDRITILLSKLTTNSGGYFYSGDEYPKAQVSNSNEKEMIYFNVDFVTDPLAKDYLAHEFVHMINFNQKERLNGAEEEVWLNEARAEMAPTILGYNDVYANSSLQKRVRTFIQNPNDSLTEFKGDISDYGVLNIFTQYLLDHYGSKILVDSLHSPETGIASLNEALAKNGYDEDFSDIFTNWTVALLVNDCTLGSKYCFLNKSLTGLKVVPDLTYLPIGGESTLTITDYSKDWSGNWLKFIGGDGTLKLDFIGDSKIDFKVPYVLKDSSGKSSVRFLDLNSLSSGNIYIVDFGTGYESLTILPSAQEKLSGFGSLENYRKFIWSVSVSNGSSNEEEELIQQLTAQIVYLQAEIARLQAQLVAMLGGQQQSGECNIKSNLYYGMGNNEEVKCLQQFLKDEGVYTEGLVTGNFYSLTFQAVIRFQEKYAAEILYPVGLQEGTGFVGDRTRQKISELMGN
jgi:hypothetical protein